MRLICIIVENTYQNSSVGAWLGLETWFVPSLTPTLDSRELDFDSFDDGVDERRLPQFDELPRSDDFLSSSKYFSS
jgi:hypothetical protein